MQVHGFGFWLFNKRYSINYFKLLNGKYYFEIKFCNRLKTFTV